MATPLGKKIGCGIEQDIPLYRRTMMDGIFDEPIEEDIPLLIRFWQKGELMKEEDRREREKPEN